MAVLNNQVHDIENLVIQYGRVNRAAIYDAVLLQAIVYGQRETFQAALDIGASPHSRPRWARDK